MSGGCSWAAFCGQKSILGGMLDKHDKKAKEAKEKKAAEKAAAKASETKL